LGYHIQLGLYYLHNLDKALLQTSISTAVSVTTTRTTTTTPHPRKFTGAEGEENIRAYKMEN
jgi:hypothetical protein